MAFTFRPFFLFLQKLSLLSKMKYYIIKLGQGIYTGCSKSLGHILIMIISETIKDIKTHLVNSKACNLKFCMECLKMFSVSTIGHTTHIKSIV